MHRTQRAPARQPRPGLSVNTLPSGGRGGMHREPGGRRPVASSGVVCWYTTLAPGAHGDSALSRPSVMRSRPAPGVEG